MNLRQDVVKKIVHVGIALDESGSMAGCKQQTLNGLNEQLQELRKHQDIDTTVTLVTFAGDKDIKVKFSGKPIAEIADLKDEDYNPDGGTAMYDGVARLLNEFQSKVADDENTTYVVMVVSDGEENQSKEYNATKIAEMIQERQKTKRWTINYIGANQDLTKVSKSMHLGTGNVMAYGASEVGTQQMWNQLGTSTRAYYSVRSRESSAVSPDMVLASANFVSQTTQPPADTNS